ncbi:tetratricopeptide repeat protein [Kocuria rosea]|uniref:tetratricopeptide repeat protein n=1 Tax=Kocuria rosea TaxID=1275 RepID=UPI002540A0B5|nr:tetratricopeptide repeat protein [Kocuria rosea]WIG18774.1 tetratricopeptide repeat protein [Kocuria rosea]
MLNPSHDNAQVPDHDSAARVNYLWWALHATPGKCAALEAERYLNKHAAPIAEAVQTAEDLPLARLRALIELTCLLPAVLGLVGMATAPAGIVTSPVTWTSVGPAGLAGLKDALPAGNALQAALQTRNSILRKGLQQDAMTSFNAGTRLEALEAARNSGLLFSLVSEVIPSVIVVDEAEHLDAATAQMLKTIARDSAHRGLVVLLRTTDDAGHPLPALEADVDTWLEEDARLGRLSTLTLEPFSSEEMIELALQEMGATDENQLDTQNLAIVLDASHGRPAFLSHYLTRPAVQDAVVGKGTLPDLKNIPLTRRLDPYTEEAFDDLPAPVQQQALATLSLLGHAIPTAWLATMPLDSTTLPPVDPLLTDEELIATTTTGWVSEDVLSQALRFRSRRAHAVAFAQIPAQLTPERQRQVLTTATDHIAAARAIKAWENVIYSVRESILAALNSQQSNETGFELEADLVAELMQMRRLTARPAADPMTLSVLEERLRTGTSSIRLRISVAEALLEAGHTERSLTVLRDELDRVTAKWGKDVPQTFLALTNLAAAWATKARINRGHPQAGSYFDTAIALYQRLLTGQSRHTPAGDDRIFRTRSILAQLLADAFRYSEAVWQIQICIHEMEAHPGYGPDCLDTLIARSDHGNWTGRAGDPRAARDLLTALLADVERVLGPTHPDTLAIRANLASWIGQAGDPRAARDLLTALLADVERVLGPDHPDTLVIRGSLASWIGQAGDPRAARDLLTALLADVERVLGPDHPTTFNTRNNQATWTAAAGDSATARDLFADLLHDRQRVLGKDHPDTLTARGNLASWTGDAGNPAGARDLFADLLHDRQRVLGKDHLDTQFTQHNLATWTGYSGNPAGARDLFADLLSARRRVLGADHPDTLLTRSNLALWTGQAGNPAGARDFFADLLPDVERILGGGSSAAVATRTNLKHWSHQAEIPNKAD